MREYKFIINYIGSCFIMKKRLLLIILSALMCVPVYGCAEQPVVYNGEFLERKLTQAYAIDAILTQNGERYDVSIEGAGSLGGGEFKIKFLSGDVTEGLTIEFFENGVFLFFDDFRFKTNSETFTNLESLKNSFEILSAPYVEKYVTDLAPVDGIDIIEVGVHSESGDIRAYINELDGSIIRLMTSLNGADITLDIKKFENVLPEAALEDAHIFEVTDDYIGDY